jgi:hypothetical protein
VAGFLARLLIACLTGRRIEFTKGRREYLSGRSRVFGGGDCGTAEAVPLRGNYTKRQKSYGNGFRVSADTETLLYTERNACPPGKKVVPNNRPANSDGHLVAGAADSSASEPPWDSARNDSIVASVPVWDH